MENKLRYRITHLIQRMFLVNLEASNLELVISLFWEVAKIHLIATSSRG